MTIKHLKILLSTLLLLLMLISPCNGETISYPNDVYENSSFNKISTLISTANNDGATTDGTYLYTVCDDTIAKYWLNNGTLISTNSTTGPRGGISDNFGSIIYYDGSLYATFGKYDSPFRSYVAKISPATFVCDELYNTTNSFNAATQAIFNYNDIFYIADAVTATNTNRTVSKMYSNWTVEKVVYISDNDVGSGWQDAVVVGSKIYITSHGDDTRVWVFEYDNTQDEMILLYNINSLVADDYFEGITYWDGYFYVMSWQNTPRGIIKATDTSCGYVSDWTGMSGTMLHHGDDNLRNPPKLTTNLLAYYNPNTDNQNSSVLHDVYGNYDGTIHGATFNGNSLDYDGTDYVSTSLMLDTNESFTMIGRSAVTNKNDRQLFFGSVGADGTYYRSYIGLRDGNYSIGTGVTRPYSVPADAITNGVEFDWARTAISGTHKYYVNGDEVFSGAYDGTGQQVWGNYIGAAYYDGGAIEYLTGSVGYVKVFDAGLSQSEMNDSHAGYYNLSSYYQTDVSDDAGAGYEWKYYWINGTDTGVNTSIHLQVKQHDTATWETVDADVTMNANNTIPSGATYQNASFRLFANTSSQLESDLLESILIISSVDGEGGDTTDPTHSGATHSTTEAGNSCTFGIQYNDDTALHTDGQYIFATNNTGSWVNESAVNFTATPQTIETTKTLTSSVGETVGYRWYVSDNAGNTADTPIYTLETTETHIVTYVDVAALVTGTVLTVTTDMTGATFTSTGDSVWDYEKGIDLFTGVGGLIVLAVILIIVSSVVVGMRGELQIEKLIGITMGILVLVVIFPMIVMTGAQIEEVSDAGDGSAATLTITDVPFPGQTFEINSETFTLTDGTAGAYLVDIGSNPDTTYVASQIVDSINAYSSVVSAE